MLLSRQEIMVMVEKAQWTHTAYVNEGQQLIRY